MSREKMFLMNVLHMVLIYLLPFQIMIMHIRERTCALVNALYHIFYIQKGASYPFRSL